MGVILIGSDPSANTNVIANSSDVSSLDVIEIQATDERMFQILKDNNDNTCVNTEAITIEWKRFYAIHWTRVVVTDPALLYNDLHVFSREVRSDKEQEVNITASIVHNTSIDLYFTIKTLARFILRSKSNVNLGICSMWISGGRNVALKQVTKQSSVLGMSQSNNAVDGNRKTCSRTDPQDGSPHWSITFAIPYPIRNFALHFEAKNRLYMYTMKSINEHGQDVGAYTSTYKDDLDELISAKTVMVKSIKVQVDHKLTGDGSLVICEFEAYTECPPMKWGLE
ncbi:uncharacterized protein LOC129926216 [Biomphalaria glabrata]|uniref:Uncharacterized protein LOC129926216 n=1 Tax=Biomphalaria glabrata TaxID=6526 RepID=A0A9W3ABR4_BIOGL|nr:uncharacterized protein LOC129926216 [Biomphalaria glabrata]